MATAVDEAAECKPVVLTRDAVDRSRLPKIPRFHLDRVDVDIRDIDVPRPGCFGGEPSRVRCRAPMMVLVTAPVR